MMDASGLLFCLLVGRRVAWVKLDDHIDEHPKIAAIGNDALALFVCGLAYCNRNLTDGFIPRMVGLGQLRFCENGTPGAIQQLEEASLWEPCNGGWQVHDYPDYQPSRERVLAEREAGKKRAADSYSRKQQSHSSGEEIAKKQRIFGDSSPDPESRIPNPVLSRFPTPDSRAKVKGSADVSRKNGATPSAPVWSAYSMAYEERYHVQPTRNAKVNALIVRFMTLVPIEEAPQIAAFFVWHNGRWYTEKGHCLECLVKDAEKIRTEWLTGKQVTSHKSRETDRLQGVGEMWQEISDELHAEGKLK